MKELFETIDGKVFKDITKAHNYENKLNQESKVRKNILKDKFSNVLESGLVEVSRDYDSGGDRTGYDILSGSKVALINYIALNRKYWMYNQCSIRKLEYITVKDQEYIESKKELKEGSIISDLQYHLVDKLDKHKYVIESIRYISEGIGVSAGDVYPAHRELKLRRYDGKYNKLNKCITVSVECYYRNDAIKSFKIVDFLTKTFI
jgi:hypothetical protein